MTALLIIFEMTNDYRIVLPLMVTVALASLVARVLLSDSIYTIKLAKRGIDIRSGRDINVLKAHSVGEIIDSAFDTIEASASVADILNNMEQSRESAFLVVRGDGSLEGLVSFQDIRSLVATRELDSLVVAHDLVQRDIEVVEEDSTLDDAMNAFNVRGMRMLPVVARGRARQVVGIIRRDDLIEFYNRKLVEHLKR